MAALNLQRRPLLAFAAVLAFAVIVAQGITPGGRSEGPATAQVEEGPFDLYISGEARVDARQSVTLASELPSNSAKIIWMLPEGSQVAAGDVVLRFDPAPLEADLTDLERKHADATAAMLQAEADLQLQVQGGRDAQAAAAEAIASAELELKRLSKAELPLRVAKARSEVLAARTEAARAREEHEAQKEMFEGGFGSRAMVEEAAAAEIEAATRLDLAENQLELLEKVNLPGELEQTRLELAGRRRELGHQEQSNLQSLAKHNAVLMRARNAVETLATGMQAARARLDLTTLKAPVSGFVVYKPVAIDGETRKVQVGDSVWQRHGFVVIPDMSALVATLAVAEQDIGRVQPDQSVVLQPAAYPQLQLAGRVEQVGTLAAESGSDGTSRFEVRVAVDGVDPRLRPGMRATARILTGHFEEVLKAPVEAVFFDGGEPYCYVWNWGSAHRRTLRIGDSDGTWVVIEDGLDAGDRLLLSHPDAAVAAGG